MPEDSRRQHQEQSSLKRATEVERLVFFGDAVFAIVLSALPEEESQVRPVAEQGPATADRNPIFALLGANAVSQVGNMIIMVAIPQFVLETTGSAARTGLAAAAIGVEAILAADPLVDKLGFKRASVLADLASGEPVAAIPLLYLGSATRGTCAATRAYTTMRQTSPSDASGGSGRPPTVVCQTYYALNEAAPVVPELGEKNLVDHLVLFAVKDDASAEEVEDLLSSIRNLRSSITNVMDLSVGEDFSGRGGDYTHGLFVRFRTADDLRAYLEHPEHQAVIQKLDATTTGRLVVDYDHEPQSKALQEHGYKSIAPGELKEKLDRGENMVMLDVREPWEFTLASIEGSKLVPMPEILDRLPELDPAAETVVICHHGARSAFVTQVLDRSGFAAVYNLEGGLDAYSFVDGAVPRY